MPHPETHLRSGACGLSVSPRIGTEFAFLACRESLRVAPGVREGRKAAKALVAGCHRWEEGCSKDSNTNLTHVPVYSEASPPLPRALGHYQTLMRKVHTSEGPWWVTLVPEKPGHLFPGVRLGVCSAAVGILRCTSQEGGQPLLTHMNIPGPGEAHMCSLTHLPLADCIV